LSFLGVGVPPTTPSLGTLIRIGNDFLFSGEWWITLFPGLALILLALSVNLLGDWLRDALNPKLRCEESRNRLMADRTLAPHSPAEAHKGGKPPVLEVWNVQVESPTRRGLLKAVRAVSFSLQEGEILGVVGESGAGKSLTGTAVIGLLEPP